MSGTTMAKVLARGQVTLPSHLRREVGVKPGDAVAIRATGPGTLEIRVIPRLTLEEMFSCYRIESPLDEASDREAWQAEAAKDVLRGHEQ